MIRTKPRWIAFSQRIDEFIVEIVELRRDCRIDSLLVHLPAPIDVFFEPVVKIVVASAVRNFLLIVKFDLANQKTREPARVVVEFLVLIEGACACCHGSGFAGV